MTAIHVSRLHKSFDYYKKEAGLRSSLGNLIRREKLSKDAVGDISFDIEAGDIVGFLGPNGAGKTTTLKMLAGILYPSSGEAGVLGYVPWERKNEFKRQFSIVMGQKSQLWWDLPANESFYLNKCIDQIDDTQYKKTVSELADYLDVKGLMSVQVRRLSLGERMKMELIACLLHNPKVIFLDEPTIGLDFTSQRKIREFLQVYNRETRATMILTSTLDMYLTKPLSLLFTVSLRRMNFALPIPNLAAGLIMLITAWRRLGIPVSAVSLLGLLGVILSSTLVMYSIFMIPQALSFWFVKSTSITELSDRSWDFNNMPMAIYSEPVRRIGMFFLPILFITNMPTLYLTGQMTLTYAVWVFVAPAVFFPALIVLWKRGLRRYTSASS